MGSNEKMIEYEVGRFARMYDECIPTLKHAMVPSMKVLFLSTVGEEIRDYVSSALDERYPDISFENSVLNVSSTAK